MRRVLMFLAGAALVLGARVGVAQEPGEARPERGAQMFERLDRDGDGQVALDELPDRIPEQLKSMLARADADGDKKVTKEELKKASENARAGRPGPGRRGDGPPRGRFGPPSDERGARGPSGARKVGRGPEAAMRHRGGRPEAVPGGGRGDRNGDRSRGRSAARPGVERLGWPGKGFLAAIDKDNDGAVSKQEMLDLAEKSFDKADANDDGKIDREEGRLAMMAMMKARFQGRSAIGARSHGRSGPRGMGRHGFGLWQRPMMGPWMHGHGSKFGAPMSPWSKGPWMEFRGHSWALGFGHGMRGPSSWRFGSMAWGPRGPKMDDHRGRHRGPEMDRGSRGDGPRFGGPMGPGRPGARGDAKPGGRDKKDSPEERRSETKKPVDKKSEAKEGSSAEE